MWIRKVRVLRKTPPEGAGRACPLVVDLTQARSARGRSPPTLGHRTACSTWSSSRKSIRRRIHGLQNDEEPATLGLPAGASALDALDQLQRLHKLWCEGAPPRPPAKVPDETTAGLAFGLNEIHFFVDRRQGLRAARQEARAHAPGEERHRDVRARDRAHPGDDDRRAQLHGRELGRGRRDAGRLAPAAPADLVARAWRSGAWWRCALGDTAPFFLGKVSALVAGDRRACRRSR